MVTNHHRYMKLPMGNRRRYMRRMDSLANSIVTLYMTAQITHPRNRFGYKYSRLMSHMCLPAPHRVAYWNSDISPSQHRKAKRVQSASPC